MSEGKKICSDSPKNDQSKKIKTISRMKNPTDGEIADLPEEIVIQILKLLPVKSLLRFKCVCKSWLSLISSSEFIKTHLKYSINSTNLSNHRIMFTIYHPEDKLKHCSAHSLMFEPLTVTHEIDYPMKNPPRLIRIVGSCDGLICFAMYRNNAYLWNPSTRIWKELPSPAVELKHAFYCMYGFGYNESDDDYKVVAILHDLQQTGVRKPKSRAKIYSLKTNSWKMIGDFEAGDSLYDSGTFASGKLHFVTKMEVESNDDWALVSLDLKSELYGKVELPNYEKGYSVPLLGVLRGCICLTLNYREIRADVWVLKECDVKESWTKVISIPYDTLGIGFPARNGINFYLNPLMLPTGETLLLFGEHLLIYNPRDNCFRRPLTNKSDYFLRANMYVESLVSL